MRIVGGTLKGRKLERPEGEAIRPTSDKVRGAIFNAIALYVEDALFLDGFAGSGAMGIEALSRGAKHCIFLDINPKSIALIKKNLYNCRIAEKSTVQKQNFLNFLNRTTAKFDIIFLDPPYAMAEIASLPVAVANADVLSDGGLLIVEHGSEIGLDDVGGLEKIKEKKYSNTTITYYMREQE